MLNEFTECPKALFREYLEKGTDKMDRMIACSCNECKQCTLKCPKEFELRKVFQGLKEQYANENKGIVPLEELKSAEAGQIKESAEEYCTALPAASGKKKAPKKHKTKYVLFPAALYLIILQRMLKM